MSAMGQERPFQPSPAMSALPPLAAAGIDWLNSSLSQRSPWPAPFPGANARVSLTHRFPQPSRGDVHTAAIVVLNSCHASERRGLGLSDYYVHVKRTGPFQSKWEWRILRRSKEIDVGLFGKGFATEAEARRHGAVALTKFLADLETSGA